jgi:AcrR family transcriptional regulator
MRPRQFTDEEMLSVARQCFLAHGPGVSTQTIADALGVTAAALFRRVGNKRELLFRALAPELPPPFVNMLEAGPDDRPVLAQVVELATKVDAFFRSMAPFLSVLRASGLTPKDMFERFDEPPPLRAVRALTAWLSTLHGAGRVHVPSPEAAALAFLGGLQSRHFMQHTCGHSYPKGGADYVEVFAHLYYRGIAPLSEPRPEAPE